MRLRKKGNECVENDWGTSDEDIRVGLVREMGMEIYRYKFMHDRDKRERW